MAVLGERFGEKRREELISFCQKLIRIQSCSGAEQGVAELLKESMETFGYGGTETDRYGNVIGYIKGNRAEIKVETFGVPAHSANPEKGVNAVYAMTDFVRRARGLETPAHPVLGKGILELTDIKSSPYPGASVVPEYCAATYDRRLLTGETRESVLAPLRALAEQMGKENPSFCAKVSYASGEETCYTGEKISGERFFPAWLYREEEPFVQDILRTFRELGLDAAVTKYDFCTNGSHYAGEAGIPTVGMGPSDESLAHVIDEYVEIGQLIGAAMRYYAILTALCGTAE